MMLPYRLLVLAILWTNAWLVQVVVREATQELHAFASTRLLLLSAPAAATARHCNERAAPQPRGPLHCERQLSIFTGQRDNATDVCASSAPVANRRRRYQLIWRCEWRYAGLLLPLPELRTTIVR